MEIRNPATNKIITSLQTDTVESLREKFQMLEKAQDTIRQIPIADRVRFVKRFGELLREKVDELANDLSSEMGKPLQEAKNEVKGAAHRLKFFIEQSEQLLQDEAVNEAQGTQEVLSLDPHGIVCNISAWNYPYVIAVNVLIPALIAGNTVMYKPSEFSSLSGTHFRNLLVQAGFPEETIQLAIGDGSVGKRLCEMDFDAYAFTGSYRTGKIIAEAVAHKLVPVILELGGKDPLYVTDDIDNPKQIAAAVAEGAFYNNGQSCCSVERIYVHKDVYDDFIEFFKTEVESLKAGDPMDPDSTQGAVTQKQHLQYLENQVKDALDKGAMLEVGGKVIPSEGNFFEPTLLTNVDHSMDLMKEETFGPVIGVMRVDSDEEAVELMNDTNYGLTSSVYSKNQERGKKLLKQINSGTGYLNCCDRVSGYLPWAGRGHSGLGTTLSKYGLFQFCQPKGYHFR